MALILACSPLQAADLPDPTRPPAAFTAPPPDKAVPPPPQVVSAIYLTGAKPYALVDGIALHVGDPLGEGKVTRIDEAGVWLKEPGGVRVLRLLPGVEKSASQPAGAPSPPTPLPQTGEGRVKKSLRDFHIKAGAQSAENKPVTPRARTRRSQ